jgi:predicted transcriptional regulator
LAEIWRAASRRDASCPRWSILSSLPTSLVGAHSAASCWGSAVAPKGTVLFVGRQVDSESARYSALIRRYATLTNP